MIKPFLQDAAFLAEVAAVRADPARARLDFWWLGQSGYLICHEGDCLLFDPYLSDSLTAKYAATDKPHVRMTARVVDPARLDFVTAITSSHLHTDHCDAATLVPILQAAPAATLVLPAANLDQTLARLGDRFRPQLLPVVEHTRTSVGRFTLETVPAAHEELAPGYAGFIVTTGPFTIYHSGDTVLYPGMAGRLRPYGIDLAFLPINGRAPERRVAGNLDGVEAAVLAFSIGAGCAVPCHYEMFEFNTASPVAFAAECARVGQPCLIPRAGERVTLTARS